MLHFYGTKEKKRQKNLSVFIFYFQLQSLFPFFLWCVSKNGHLYVNMKNQDQVLIDGLLENHVGLAFLFFGAGEGGEENPERFCHDYLLICLYRDFLPACAWSLDAVAYH